jgi:hypothetical protein
MYIVDVIDQVVPANTTFVLNAEALRPANASILFAGIAKFVVSNPAAGVTFKAEK